MLKQDSVKDMFQKQSKKRKVLEKEPSLEDPQLLPTTKKVHLTNENLKKV